MAKEIELKYAVDRNVLTQLDLTNSDHIEQAYLAVGDSEDRIRCVNEMLFTRTQKYGTGLTRIENEQPIDQTTYVWLMVRHIGNVIEKDRYKLPLEGGFVGELDVYSSRTNLDGLVVLEVEFPDEEAARNFHPPNWVSNDVTLDETYKNQSLAMNGLPQTRSST